MNRLSVQATRVPGRNEAEGQSGQHGEIAVVGMSCRLPKASNLAAFWALLRGGASAVTEAPADRWHEEVSDDAPGVRRGGFLDEIGHFDAGFFGISPREAVAMDPQQRITLELVWEALEDASIVPTSLRGSRTGVFVGSLRDDYAGLVNQYGAEVITQHTMTGVNRGVIANRVSYDLGLHGPSLSVDAAQSSALVAVHLACESLRSGESAMAVAAGVNLNILPESAVTEQRFGGLSPDGECYTFDARANGFVRGEGAGVVVLKPLDQALADGDRIHGVIRGSAVNNDGATDGLTVPGQQAQEEVLRQAYDSAGVTPDEVQYVELHGTGTPVGDPIEAAALGAAVGVRRAEPLPVGSAKTNVGHLEGAAGMVGLLKVLLSMRHRELPANRNFETPNPRIPLDEFNLSVQRELTPWPHPDRPLLAGVSSFGMGGTNCHVVVAEGPRPAETRAADPTTPPAVPWVVSGRSPAALRAQADRLRSRMAEDDAPNVVDVGLSLVTDRAEFEHRAVVVGENRDGLLSGLSALAEGSADGEVVYGPPSGAGSAGDRVVLLFPGQGHQWAGMAVELWDSSPVFARRMRECQQALAEFVDWDLGSVLRGEPDAASLERVDVVQPVLFAVMVSLAELWRSYGVRPVAVVGHSQGEIAAACVAEALSLRDAAMVVALRSKMLTQLAGQGGMASVVLDRERAVERIEPWAGRLSVAAVNGPGSVVVAGEVTALDEFLAQCAADDIQARRVAVDYASHSAQVEEIREQLLETLDSVTPRASTIPFYSTVTGGLLDGSELDGAYWYRNLRQTVRLEETVAALLQDEDAVFVEASAHPMLATGVEQTAEACGAEDTAVVGSLRRGAGGPRQFMTSLAEAYVHGVDIQWAAAFDGTGAARVELPTYAFQRERYWVGEQPPQAETAAGAGVLRRLVGADERERRRELTELVRAHAAAVLEYPTPSAVDARKTFKDLGVDSRTSVELRTRLSGTTGLRLPTSLLFDHPTPDALARYLDSELTEIPDEQPVEVIEPVPARTARRTRNTTEPIAIVGIACRYPGGVSAPEDLWRLVAEGGDAISTFPTDRGWDTDLYDQDPEHSGKSYVRTGGFLHDAGEFDAAFFGISPREALAMDPQQRLLLETAWEAVEHAGIDPESLRGSRTGVFVGATALDYGPRMHDAPENVEGHLLTGGTSSIMSGRIAYQFGLNGPAMTVDTACSSSLVALHMAVRSLRSGESTLALAGGVTVMSSPGMFVEFSRQRGLAPDGRCKSFAASADGTAWAEGTGLLLVERLSDARRNGHPVLAVIRGSAINSDGASNGLTAPNGLSQQRVIREALADADLSTMDVDAVEAHGTGTELGDPIEAEAILATYGRNRAERDPLLLGSLKSNIGHAQAAAGVGGVIKMVEAMRRGVLPRTLHVDEPTPHVDWTSGAVELLTEQRPWPQVGRPARAAVSSFGISGTNAHVILEQAPSVEPVAETPEPTTPVPWLISARDDTALRGQAARLREFAAAAPNPRPVDIGGSLNGTRTAFEKRAAVLGTDIADFLAGLDAVIEGREAPNVVYGTATSAGSTAFLFAGQGAQRAGMGRELYREYPVFAEALDAVFAEVDQHLARPLREIMFAEEGTEDADLLHRTEYTQPALFAVEVALFRLLEHYGLAPDLLVGHSIGEVAAAHVADVLTLADAATLVTARGRLMQAARSDGTMIAIAATEAEVADSLMGYDTDIGIAAVNAPDSVVISGDEGIAEFVAATWTAQGRKTRKLQVSHAFHSPHMDEIVGEFREVAEKLTFGAPTIPIVSTVTGKAVTTDELSSSDYWARQISGTVRFLDAVRTLADRGATTFVEVGPDATLTGLTRQCLPEDGPTTIPLLRVGRPETDTVVAGLARAKASGADLDLAPFFPGAARVDLPTYAFQREHYWLAPRTSTDARGLGLDTSGHPLLAATVELAERDELVSTSRLSVTSHPWLADHAVNGSVLVPATAFLELAFAAGEQVNARRVDELNLEAPLVLPEAAAVVVQVALAAQDGSGSRAFTVHSRPDDGDEPASWTRHASGVLTDAATGTAEDLRQWPPEGATEEPLTDAYARLADLGYEYGPAFQGLRALWRRGDELFAEVRLSEQTRDTAARFGVHPALLDAALHPYVLTAGEDERGRILLPFGWSGAALRTAGATALRVRLRPAGTDKVSLALADQTGAPVATIDALSLRPVDAEQLARATGPRGDSLLTVQWPSIPTPEAAEPRLAMVTGDELPAPDGADAVVVSFPAGDRHTAETARTAAHRALRLVRQWLADERYADSTLVFATTGAVAALSNEDVTDLSAAPVWGLIRSVQSEHPGRVVLVDLDGPDGEALLPAAVTSGEPQVAVRGGKLHVPRLAPAAPENRVELPELDPNGTVLVTGGTGGLGGLMARHLVTQHGARHLLLCSRRGDQAPGAAELAGQLTELGAEVTLAAADVADRDALAELLGTIPSEHPLTAVVHTAGVLADATVESLTDEQLDTVLRPKIDAAWHLHELTQDSKLAVFILLSSASGIVGMAGQANYAAGNTFLDALAAHRSASGLAGNAHAWGLWDDTQGLGGTLTESGIDRWARSGITPLTPEQGLALFDAALAQDAALVVPTGLNLGRLHTEAEPPAVFRGLVRKRTSRASQAGAQPDGAVRSDWMRDMAELTEDKRATAVLEHVRGIVATALGHADPRTIESDRAFQEIGVDSLTAVELRNQLNTTTGLRLPSTVVLDYPSVSALAGYLTAQIVVEEVSPAEPILSDLDRMGEMIAALGDDADAQGRVAARLRELLELSSSANGTASDDHDDLESASDEELFAYIDDRVG